MFLSCGVEGTKKLGWLSGLSPCSVFAHGISTMGRLSVSHPAFFFNCLRTSLVPHTRTYLVYGGVSVGQTDPRCPPTSRGKTDRVPHAHTFRVHVCIITRRTPKRCSPGVILEDLRDPFEGVGVGTHQAFDAWYGGLWTGLEPNCTPRTKRLECVFIDNVLYFFVVV